MRSDAIRYDVFVIVFFSRFLSFFLRFSSMMVAAIRIMTLLYDNNHMMTRAIVTFCGYISFILTIIMLYFLHVEISFIFFSLTKTQQTVKNAFRFDKHPHFESHCFQVHSRHRSGSNSENM